MGSAWRLRSGLPVHMTGRLRSSANRVSDPSSESSCRSIPHRFLQTFFRIARQHRRRRFQMRIILVMLTAGLLAGIGAVGLTAQETDAEDQKITFQQLAA